MKAKKTLSVLAIVISSVMMINSNVMALIYPFNLNLSGLQEVPPNASPATGNIFGTYDDNTKTLSFTVTFSGFVGITTAAHFHAPAPPGVNAPVMIGFVGFPVGVTNGVYANAYILTPVQEGHLLSGNVYVNLHSNVFPGGEIRAQMDLDAPLPVELTGFASVISGNDVTLKWKTSSESNNRGFEVERLFEGSKWLRIGFVEGAGNSTSTLEYSYSDRNLNTGSYQYRLKQIDFNGNFEYYNLEGNILIGVPSELRLSQNYPNPFNPTTKIDFDLPFDGIATLSVYDLSGKEVAVLLNEFKPAGYHTLSVNASELSSGIYIYTLKANGYSESRKMMLLK